MLYMSDFLVSIFDKRDKPISESSRKLYQRNLEAQRREAGHQSWIFDRREQDHANHFEIQANHAKVFYYFNLYSSQEQQ